MRFRQRTKVDLPHPEGPITAVARLAGASMSMSYKAWVLPNQAFNFSTLMPTPIGQFAPLSIPRPAAMRTALTAVTIKMIRISAPAHACRCHSSKGEMAYVKTCKDKAAVGWLIFQFQY